VAVGAAFFRQIKALQGFIEGCANLAASISSKNVDACDLYGPFSGWQRRRSWSISMGDIVRVEHERKRPQADRRG
jgi:hypothetical protein